MFDRIWIQPPCMNIEVNSVGQASWSPITQTAAGTQRKSGVGRQRAEQSRRDQAQRADRAGQQRIGTQPLQKTPSTGR